MAICKYCSIDFDEKEWHEGEEKTTCFTCSCMKSATKAFMVTLGMGKYKHHKSVAYWRARLRRLIK